jgi:hypothetical protein
VELKNTRLFPEKGLHLHFLCHNSYYTIEVLSLAIADSIGPSWHSDYPDYNTQGETLEEFEDMLRSLYEDIKAYNFSFVRQGILM